MELLVGRFNPIGTSGPPVCRTNSQLSEGKVRRGDGISRFLYVKDRARFGSDRNSGVFFLPILWRAASSTLGLFSVYTMALSLKMTKL